MLSDIERQIFGQRVANSINVQIINLLRLLVPESVTFLGGDYDSEIAFEVHGEDRNSSTLEFVEIVKDIATHCGLTLDKTADPTRSVKAIKTPGTDIDAGVSSEYILRNLEDYKRRIGTLQAAEDLALGLTNSLENLRSIYRERLLQHTEDYKAVQQVEFINPAAFPEILVLMANRHNLGSGDLLKDVMGTKDGPEKAAKEIAKALAEMGRTEQAALLGRVAGILNLPLTAITAAAKAAEKDH